MSLPPPSRRLRLTLWIAAALLVVFTLVGFLVVPPIVQAQLERRVTEALGRTTTVGAVKFNPYTLGLTIERLDIQRLDQTGSFAGWDRLYVNVDALASLGGTFSLHAIELEGFHVTASIERDGKFNFADILEKLQAAAAKEQSGAKPAAPAKPLALHIGRLAVANARVDFSDRSRVHPFATVLGPVSFNLTEFRTLAERGAPFRFAAVTEAGEKFAWEGTLVAAPFSSRGELAIEQLTLPKYVAYYADRLGADLTDGRLSLRLKYEVAIDGERRTARINEGAVQLRGFKLTERSTREVALDLPAVDVTGLMADAIKGQASVSQVRVHGGAIAARREADGAINWLSFFPSAPEAAQATGGAGTAAVAGGPSASGSTRSTFDLAIGEVAAEGLKVTFTDRAVPRGAALALENVKLSVKQFSLAEGAEMLVETGFSWVPQGTFAASGVVTLKPELRAVLQTELKDFSLAPLSPYLEQHVNARLTQGAVSFDQKITFAQPKDAKPTVDVTGWLRVANLGLVDGAQQQELAGFSLLELAGLKAHAGQKLELSLDGLKLAQPYARVVVREDKSLNLAGLVAASPAAGQGSAPASTSGQTAEAPAPLIRVGGVTIEGGNFSFTDRSLAPQVRVALGDFGGTIGELSSTAIARAKVDLRGVVDGVGQVAVQGELDPLGSPRFVDLKVGVKNLDLVPFSPYSGKYAGYELARGKFGLDVQARLEGDQLQSQNVITLGQFTFGAPVESKDATKLPVRFGVALLKDLNGQIVIDVPMSGNVNDPELRIGKVVWRVIGNLLTKAAVSPFALVGSMFGGGGEELAFQQFEPGTSELTERARTKLETLVKALQARPGLSLGIDGAFDPAADAYALQRVKLDALLRGRIWEQRRATDPNLPPPDRLEITPEARVAQVKQLFDAQFPPGTKFGTPLPQPPAVVDPPKPPQGLFKRVIRVVTLADRREKRAAEAVNQQRASEHAAAVEAAKAAGVPLEEMTARLAETMEVTPDDLRALADARAARVRDYFLQVGKIEADRLFLTKRAPTNAAAPNRGPRVFLTLQ
jgi:hypothetical protein